MSHKSRKNPLEILQALMARITSGGSTTDADTTHEIIALAKALGSADDAIVVWILRKWLAANEARNNHDHFREGRWWVYMSLVELSADHLPWLSSPQLTRLMKKLVDTKVVIRQRFKSDFLDPLYWYSIDDDVLTRLIAASIKPLDPSRIVFHGDRLPWTRDGEIWDEAIWDGNPSRPKEKRSQDAGYVYLLKGANGLHKIGLSTNAERRLKQFDGLPFDVEYICVIETPDMRKLESFLHARFAAKRVKGEWFNLDAEDVDYIRSLTLEGL